MKHLFSFIFFFYLTGAVLAQTNADYTGTYMINKEKVDFGKAPDWILPVKYKIEKNKDNFIITTTTVDGQGTESSYKIAPIFGNEPQESLDSKGREIKTTITWNTDKSAFTVNYNNSDGGKIAATWSLTNNGKTLVVDRNVEQANGLKYNLKGFYERQ